MFSIYSLAFSTIVAASGDNLNAGLLGLRSGTRFYKQKEAIVIPPTTQDGRLSLTTLVTSQPKHWAHAFAAEKKIVLAGNGHIALRQCKSENSQDGI
jgi:hypothetical protein